jgi:hypothetical protein
MAKSASSSLPRASGLPEHLVRAVHDRLGNADELTGISRFVQR